MPSMYRLAEIIENNGALSMVGEISFHPSAPYFAATYQNINEVRIYDSLTRKLLQVLRNPESQLDGPHGVLLTEKYLLTSNAHNLKRPGTINVYRSDATLKKPIPLFVQRPIQLFQSPFDHLREPHTLAMRNGRLVITYCENVMPSGAIVSYGFNEETGEIAGPLDKIESWFSEYGDSKGVCFNADGTKILVTFESDKQWSVLGRILLSFASNKHLPVSDKLRKFSYKTINSLTRQTKFVNDTLRGIHGKKSVELENAGLRYTKPTKNGIAVFSITTDGKIARIPEKIILRKKFCRLENIDIVDGTCVITDLVNQAFFLYDLTQDPKFKNPVQIVNLGNATPHGAKFAPDGSLLVITSVGLKILNQEPQFDGWVSPREDKIFVFERASVTSPKSLKIQWTTHRRKEAVQSSISGSLRAPRLLFSPVESTAKTPNPPIA